MPDYFEKVAKVAQEIHDMAYAGHPLFKIYNRAYSLGSFIAPGSSTASEMMDKAYDVWWAGLKHLFKTSLVQFMANGGKLVRTQVAAFDKEFQRYLKSERRGYYYDYRTISALLGLTYSELGEEDIKVKENILRAYGEVIGLYKRAIETSKFEKDKEYLRKKLAKYEYVVRLLENVDGLADKLRERHRQRRDKLHAKHMAEMEAENKAKELEVPS